MPSSPSALLNLELQADGENLNAWGAKLNDLFSRMEEAVSGAVAVTVSGSVTLSSTDYVVNQHRYAMLVLTGTGGTVTVPATSKTYLVKNGCTGAVTFTHGSGTTVTVAAGKIKWIATDGTDFFTAEEEDYLLLTGGTLTGALTLSGAPTADLHAATKAYADLMLPLAGGTMTGALILSGDPTADNEAATKAWVESVALGSVSVSFAWADVTGKPTTIAGYGITDAYTKSETYTQSEADAAFQPVNSDLTTIAGQTNTTLGLSALTRPTPREVDNTDSPVTAVSGDTIFVDCSSGAVEIDLPAATAGSLPISIIDDDGSSATNNITVDPNGSETINGETSIEIDQARAAVTLIPFAGRWQIKK